MALAYSAAFWQQLAESRGFADEAALWRGLYLGAEGQQSVLEIASELQLGFHTVRRRLIHHGFSIRTRGGSRSPTPPLTAEELDAILAEGISAAAARLGVGYFVLHYQVKRAVRARRLAAVAAAAERKRS